MTSFSDEVRRALANGEFQPFFQPLVMLRTGELQGFEILARWNKMPLEEAAREILPCCGSATWAASMASKRPLGEEAAVLAASDEIWRGLGEEDWLEAFRSHPRIGESRAAQSPAASPKAPREKNATLWTGCTSRVRPTCRDCT